MGVVGTTMVGFSGGAVLGLGGFAALGAQPPELLTLAVTTGALGGVSGLAAGAAGIKLGRVPAALVGAGAAGAITTGLFVAAQRTSGDLHAGLVAGSVMSLIGGVGASAALLGRALLR